MATVGFLSPRGSGHARRELQALIWGRYLINSEFCVVFGVWGVVLGVVGATVSRDVVASASFVDSELISLSLGPKSDHS